ncbi:MAG: nitrous oxide reductase family maturation protein NosD [Bacillota bacterium]
MRCQIKGILVVIVFMLLFPKAAMGLTIEVWQGGPVGSITAALEKANDGDVIRVHPGVYQERLVIEKSVELLGLGCPIIDGGGTGDVITILSDGVTIKGFEIIGSGKKLENADAGIKIKSGSNVIADNRIVNNHFGLYLDRSENNVIMRNLIKGRPVKSQETDAQKEENPYAGYHPVFAGEGGDGIHLFASSENLIEHNVIVDTRDGIYFNYAANNRLVGNQISHTRYGIHYMYSDNNYFEHNLLTYNVAGAAPMFSKNIVFRENVFAHSRGHRAYGILFATCDDSLAEGNIIIDNTRGVFFDVSMRNVFRRNLVALNDIGIDLISSSSDNLFIENNFVDNLQQIAMIAGNTGQGNRFYQDGRGNYWSDYRGFDLDRDGIGDTPHLTGDPFVYLMAKVPAVRLFLNSPAAKAMEFSERMFPIIDIPKVKDAYPLAEQMEIIIPNFALKHKQVSNKVLGQCSAVMLLIAFSIFYWVFRSNSPLGYCRSLISRRGGML